MCKNYSRIVSLEYPHVCFCVEPWATWCVIPIPQTLYNISWLLFSNMFYFPFHIWDVILPIDYFFLGVGIPPTRCQDMNSTLSGTRRSNTFHPGRRHGNTPLRSLAIKMNTEKLFGDFLKEGKAMVLPKIQALSVVQMGRNSRKNHQAVHIMSCRGCGNNSAKESFRHKLTRLRNCFQDHKLICLGRNSDMYNSYPFVFVWIYFGNAPKPLDVYN